MGVGKEIKGPHEEAGMKKTSMKLPASHSKMGTQRLQGCRAVALLLNKLIILALSRAVTHIFIHCYLAKHLTCAQIQQSITDTE